MPMLSTKSVPIMEGAALLVRLANSPNWHVKYKAANQWMRTSTKKSDLDEAKKAAVEIVLDAMHKEKFGLPIITRSFKSVANSAIKRMEKEVKHGQGKVVYTGYAEVINKYLIPFFGAKHITSIDYKALQELDDWRIKKMRRVPKASTINTHTATLNRVFDEAVMQVYITQSQIPKIKNKKADGERGADFSLVEYRLLYRSMRSFVKQKAHRRKTKMMRDLMRDYVLFLANTGVRPGTETANLLWRNIRVDNGTVSVSVNGKTGRRDAIMRRSTLRYLKRIAERAEDFKGMTFEEVLKTGKKVFRLADGTETDNLRQTFKNFLIYADLLKCPHTGKDRTLYSLRHFYATQALIHQRVPIEYLRVSVFQVKEQLG